MTEKTRSQQTSQRISECQASAQSSRVLTDLAETPVTEAGRLSRKFGNTIYLKREDLQPVFSFKLRGAYNKISRMTAEELAQGVVASSAGNHAQGVAFCGQQFKCRATIVMPETTPQIKITAVESRGATVVLAGGNYDDAYAHAMKLRDQHDYQFVHPFDDPEVIAGQGTIAIELVRQCANLDYLFVPIGGGGIAAGVGALMRQLSPETKIIGVEPVEAASMHAAFAAGGPVDLEWVGGFADGVAVKRVGELSYQICSEVVSELITVNTDQICAAIRDCFEATRVMMEPAGALSVAGLKAYIRREKLEGKRIAAITCGANLNFERLQYIAERAALGEKSETLLSIDLAERPGSLKRLCKDLSAYNITEFNYRYQSQDNAKIFIGLKASLNHDQSALKHSLATHGYQYTLFEDNELAVNHIRYMVGGKIKDEFKEVLYRIEFPEIRGALAKFLTVLPESVNITAFHYRSHGSDRGRVLIGFSGISEIEISDLLSKNEYQFWPETDNSAYKQFLQ